MTLPIIKISNYCILPLQESLSDEELLQLMDDIAQSVDNQQIKGVIIDMSLLNLMDSFSTRIFKDLKDTLRLMGISTVMAGLQPEIALSMAKFGLDLGNIPTVLNIDEAILLMEKATIHY